MDRKQRAALHAALGDEHRLLIVEALLVGDRLPSELAALLELPTNLLAHHLNVLADASAISRQRSEGDGRRRYVIANTALLAGLGLVPPPLLGRVAFVCTHNSARSQYAAARFADSVGGAPLSAGLHPANRVHPTAVAVAAERGFDLSASTPVGYDTIEGDIDVVVSVCDRAGEQPLPSSVEHRHWSVPDPVELGTTAAFRSAFDELDRRFGSVRS
jgi:protein-tyrosine-phosphatase/DNA-binding transcriptional ArsR family regulator